MNALNKQLRTQKFISTLTLVYVVLIIVSNVMASRLTQIGPAVVDAGNITYPLLFLIGDMMTECFGYKESKKMIMKGFLFNFVFVSMTWVSTLFPLLAADELTLSYDIVFNYNMRIVLSGFICYIFGSLLNSASLVWIKNITGEKYFALRTIGSTVLGALVDTVMFSFMCWYGNVPVADIWVMILTTYIVKLIYECVIATPIAYALRHKVNAYLG